MKALLVTAFGGLLLTACAARQPLLRMFPDLKAVPESAWCEARGGLPLEVLERDERGQVKVRTAGCDILPHTSAEDQRRNIRRWLDENG